MSGVKFRASIETVHEIQICHALKLAYLHTFKSGGSSARMIQRSLCNFMKDLPLTLGFTSPFVAQAIKNLTDNGYFMYTFVREPVSRFLSGYFEIMKRIYPKDDSGVANTAGRMTMFRYFLRCVRAIQS